MAIEQVVRFAPCIFHPDCVASVRGAADTLGYAHMEVVSGAGHDAVYVHSVAPTAMIFVPCREGRSHCPEEWAETDDIALGAEVMAEAILAFDAQQGE